jgi:hypothetical protein
MKNTTTKQLKAMSQNTLEERLDALCSIIATLEKYRHVFETDEKLHTMVQTEINDIVEQLEARELAEYL